MSVPVNQIICGDNVETLRTLPDACVDSLRSGVRHE